MPTCEISGTSFEVTPEETAFLEKISPVIGGQQFLIPEPQFCPEERLRIRVAHRNEQFLYHKPSALSGKNLVSLYRPESPVKIYSIEEWFSDDWDPLDYGREFDFDRSFFEQFYELSLAVPKPSLTQVQNENSPYTTGTGFCKNCYLINSSEYCEDCYYSKLLQTCTNTVDSSYCYDSELLYECFNVRNCYNCLHVYNSQNATDCSFCDDVNGCSNCFLCTNLSQKKYHFMNKPLSKDEYAAKIQEFQGYAGQQKALQLLQELRAQRICKYANIVNSEHSSGDFIRNSRHCTDCYDVTDSEDCKHVHVGVQLKDVMDCSNMYIKPELCYQVMSTIEIYNVLFSLHIFHSNNILYSEHCHNCEYLFGCSGLRNKKYCVFNKQYTKEQYEELVPRIIEHMMRISPSPSLEKRGTSPFEKGGLRGISEWGQMFPIKYSLFAYNETLANEYLPLTQKETEQRRYQWAELTASLVSHDMKKVSAQKLPDTIDQVPDDILHWGIECAETQRVFKIQKGELKFYRQQNLPLPRLHPEIRHQKRMQLRNPRQLHERECMKCGKAMQSTYSVEQPEMVYCDRCYLAAVY